MEDFLNKILSMYGTNLNEDVASIDITSEEGYQRINHILDIAENNPFALFFLTLAGISLKDVRNFINEKYEEAHNSCECKDECQCNEECECEKECECTPEEEEFYDEFDDENETPYSDRVTPEQIRTINTLVREFVDELEVNSREDFTQEERGDLSALLTEFASYVMLR